MDSAQLINIKKEFYCRCCLLTDVHLTDMSLREFDSKNQQNLFTFYQTLFGELQSHKVPVIWENKRICGTCSDSLNAAYSFRKIEHTSTSTPNLSVCCCCSCTDKDQYLNRVKLEPFTDAELQYLFTVSFGLLDVGESRICVDCLALYEKTRNFIELCWRNNKKLSEMNWSAQGQEIKVEGPAITVRSITFVQGHVKQEAEEIIEDLILYEDDSTLDGEPPPVVRKKRRLSKPKMKPPKSKRRALNENTKEPVAEPTQPFIPRSRYACDYCSEVFKFRKHYLIHMETHQEFSHQCPDCTEVFNNRFDLNKHLSLHQMDKTQRNIAPGHQKLDIRTYVTTGNQCSECLRCFPFTLDLEIHLYQVHQLLTEEKLTSFPFLEYPDELREELRHLRLNEDAQRRYECVKCDSKLNRRTAIKNHVFTVHSKVKQFPCPHCERSYKTKGSLGHHLKKHTEVPADVLPEIFTVDKDFVCSHCKKAFVTLDKMRKHERFQHTNMKYSLCKFCDKKFIQRRSLWEHSFTHRDFFAYNCLECDYKANQKQNFIKHLRKIHNQQFDPPLHDYTKEPFEAVINIVLKKFERINHTDMSEIKKETSDDENSQFCCTKCIQVFESAAVLRAHQFSSHERHFECAHCSAIYYHRHFIELHIRKHLTTDTVAQQTGQPVVKAGYKKPPALEKCERIEVDDPQNPDEKIVLFRCPSCPKTFRSKISSNRHLSQSHEMMKNRFQCLVCLNYYPTPSNLKRHLRTVHTLVRKFTCPQCPSSYKTQQCLNIHAKIHKTVDNCFRCTECEKTFQSETGLTKHIKVSHLKQVETCGVCFKSFVTYDGLFEHSFNHKGFDPFVCPDDSCSYTVKGKESFAKHLQNYHNIIYDEKLHGYDPTMDEQIKEQFAEKIRMAELELPYECDLCVNKKFRNKKVLQIHITRKHLETKIYACKFCDKKYETDSSLIRHSFEHKDGEVPFHCPQCDYKIACQQRFRTHLRKKHNVQFDQEKHGYHKETKQQLLQFVLKRTKSQDDD